MILVSCNQLGIPGPGWPFGCSAWTDSMMDELVLEGTQVIQVVEVGGTLPLITGRPALVRVLLKAPANVGRSLYAPITLTLHVKNSAGLSESLEAEGPDCVPFNLNLDDIRSTYNAVIPSDWIVGDLGLHITISLADEPMSAAHEVRFPDQGTYDYEVVVPPPFNITFVPITYGDIAADIDGINASTDLMKTAWQVFPLDEFDAEFGEPLVMDEVEGESWYDVTARALRLLSTKRTVDGSARYYFGLLPLEAFSPGGGRGYIGSPVALGRDRNVDGTVGAGLVAHELGHNFSLRHVPNCDGDTTGADPDYPHERGRIGVYGYDWDKQTLMLPTSGDMMSYCPPWWISDYHYHKVLEFRAQEAREPE